MVALRILVALTGAAILSGCMSNSVRQLDGRIQPPGRDTALVVIGLGFDVDVELPEDQRQRYSARALDQLEFGVTLDRFDLETRRAIGSCSRFDRIVYGRPGRQAPVAYAIFEVPPGWYVRGSLSSGVHPAAEPPELVQQSDTGIERAVFHAPAGQATYFGDWIIASNTARGGVDIYWRGRTIWRSDIEGAESFTQSRGLSNLRPADVRMVEGAQGASFICTP